MRSAPLWSPPSSPPRPPPSASRGGRMRLPLPPTSPPGPPESAPGWFPSRPRPPLPRRRLRLRSPGGPAGGPPPSRPCCGGCAMPGAPPSGPTAVGSGGAPAMAPWVAPAASLMRFSAARASRSRTCHIQAALLLTAVVVLNKQQPGSPHVNKLADFWQSSAGVTQATPCT